MIIFLLATLAAASLTSVVYVKHKAYFKSEKGMKEKASIQDFNTAFSKILSGKAYICLKDVGFYDDYRKTYDSIKKKKRVHKIEFYKNFLLNYEYFYKIIEKNNEAYINKELNDYKELFDDLDGKSLDFKQRRAVVIDDDNSLILAGAGSGKTLTIAAKVKYLVEKGISPKDILLISFTKKSSEEMEDRIKNKLGIQVSVKTFHKLGLDLITTKYQSRPDIKSNLSDSIDDYLNREVYKNKKNLYMIVDFFAYYLQIPKEIEDFDSLEDYHEYKMSLDYETLSSKAKSSYMDKGMHDMRTEKTTLNKEVVKSFEELMIANFLFLNGIKYEYESLYPYKSKKPYKPDFYLPEYDLYIEHFGINEEGTTPQYSELESKKYLDDMAWKRDFHQKNNTKLIETYSYLNKSGGLLTYLKKMLDQEGVVFRPLDRRAVFESVFNYSDKRYLMDFKKLIGTFIGLFKSMGYTSNDFKTVDDLADRETKAFMRVRSKLFFRIVKPIYDHYQLSLRKAGAIDFNDMINMSTKIVSDGDLDLSYKYIIIDEYQDISRSRYKLIHAIKEKTGAKLLCVGDDWQSIYRFAGSDISLFTDFESYFGKFTLSRIERTYRNSSELIDLASDFILRNKDQLKKSLKSDKHLKEPVQIISHSGDKVRALMYAIEKIVSEYGHEGHILLIGRNNSDIGFLSHSNAFTYDSGKIIYNKYKGLSIDYMSAHRSKGLEADNVIIINGENDKLGFPNKISDDPIVSYVLTKLEAYDFAEERRLFYVALTRTRNKTYLMTTHLNESIFIKEFMKTDGVSINKSLVDNTLKEVSCPKCLVGKLVERQGKKSFVGCSNYPGCDFTLNDASILRDTKRCGCGGFLIKRSGQYGEFYGCSNYPLCEHKEKVD
ncbi:hypothetical protein EZV73_27695 [Acidaminobacter sp. JC074]|uniref:UvrD-helicase domain-containing protein n=1 Tax=Acidaminobacter sp. JC074 TaxID=2530199 RepID=UPI001F0DC73D|nr:UvrD-helicase domain-containing protein [Acidaminobacter sp. JC074]MCH4891386.1 hypothetical protein [Acidaminobacter sp. JC074]